LYSLLRYLLNFEGSPWNKLLLVAKFLDKLEVDFKDAYPEDASPMPDGYEATLRKMFAEKFEN